MDPKAILQMFNMNFNIAYRIYLALMEEHNPGKQPVSMVQGIKEAAYSFLQRGGKMRTRAPDHPSLVRNMRSEYNTGCEKRKRSDAKGVAATISRAAPVEFVSIAVNLKRD